MPSKTKSGKFIISANEVGTYSVCPESWRLKAIAKVKRSRVESIESGDLLHSEWAEDYEEALWLTQSVRSIFLLIAVMILLYLVAFGFR